jgi:hypothetical protein
VSDSTYDWGERVFAPPVGSFDVEWVSRGVERSTGLAFQDAVRLVADLWWQAREKGSTDVDVLVADGWEERVPLSAVRIAARLVEAYCRAYDVDPAAR